MHTLISPLSWKPSPVGRRWLMVALVSSVCASTAQAHLELIPGSLRPDGYANMSLSVYHGCDQSPTTTVTLDIPEGLAVIRPRVKPGWEIDSERRTFDEPVEIHGETYKSGISQIIWKDGSTPSHLMDNFVFSVYVLDRPGETLKFVSRQYCDGVEEPEESVHEITVRARQSSSNAPPPPAPPEPAQESPAEAETHADGPAASRDLGMILGGLGFLMALVSLLISLRRR